MIPTSFRENGKGEGAAEVCGFRVLDNFIVEIKTMMMMDLSKLIGMGFGFKMFFFFVHSFCNFFIQPTIFYFIFCKID